MDPIFDRLGRLIRSFGTDSRSRERSSDPLEREAEEELEEFLRTGRDAPKRPSSQGSRTFHEQRRQETHHDVPVAVAQAYLVLGLTSAATWEHVNSAHRALLKEHHPDRHAGNEALVKKATDQSQKINEAYQVLKKYLGR
jgi:DnaJ-domain-containing protein 1